LVVVVTVGVFTDRGGGVNVQVKNGEDPRSEL